LQLAPELAFHPVHDRALARDAMRGLLPDQIRLRQEKPIFNSALESALNGPDARRAEEILRDLPEPLRAHLSPSSMAQLRAGSLLGAQALDAWRVLIAALWLRHEFDA
jgi:hypothetical protein